jgi:two-component system chemotaxis response regulator CheB
VLIADDSSFMRAALTHILRADSSIEIVGTAGDGVEAVALACALRPDVVLLDVDMPRMGGMAALRRIMQECPIPVVMISGFDLKHADLTARSLMSGAVDAITKPSGCISYDIANIRQEIVAKVKAAATVDPSKVARAVPARSVPLRFEGDGAQRSIVVVGASTGGPRAILAVLSQLPRNFPAAILVVQHMGVELLAHFAKHLKDHTALDVSVAHDGDTIGPGQAAVLLGGFRVAMASVDATTVRLQLRRTSVRGIDTPSIDEAMQAAAQAWGPRALGVLLTGTGSDGARGMQAIKDAGGATIAEDASTCLAFGMPKRAIEIGAVDVVVPVDRVAAAIMAML